MSTDPDALAQLVREMRMIAIVAGQCSIEGPDDEAAHIAREEAKRCSRWADTLSSVLSQREARASAWQPIATAPKDGRWMLMQGMAEKTESWWDLPVIAGWSRYGNCWRGMDGAVVGMTHWMPLPPAPVPAPQ